MNYIKDESRYINGNTVFSSKYFGLNFNCRKINMI